MARAPPPPTATATAPAGLALDTDRQTPHRCRPLPTHRVATSLGSLWGWQPVQCAAFLLESGQSLAETGSLSSSFSVSARQLPFPLILPLHFYFHSPAESKGPPHIHSSALAPTDHPASYLS